MGHLVRMVKVESRVPLLEVDGKEPPRGEPDPLVVSSHWNRRGVVVLRIGAGSLLSVSVSADDLRAAIDNATNTGRR